MSQDSIELLRRLRLRIAALIASLSTEWPRTPNNSKNLEILRQGLLLAFDESLEKHMGSVHAVHDTGGGDISMVLGAVNAANKDKSNTDSLTPMTTWLNNLPSDLGEMIRHSEIKKDASVQAYLHATAMTEARRLHREVPLQTLRNVSRLAEVAFHT